MHSPRREETPKLGTEIYSSSLNSDLRKTSNDYYYNKENEFHSKKNETDTTLLPPRSEKYSTSYVSKTQHTDNSYSSRNKNVFNPISSPIHVNLYRNPYEIYKCLLIHTKYTVYFLQMQATSPVPRNSPLTVTSTTRYESSNRNHVSSPRNYSLSPTSQVERVSPVNYVPASTQRVASPINMHRVTSPITTITHRVTSPLTSPLTVKVNIRI